MSRLIVAVGDDGSVAALCTAWLDDVTRTANLDPVATVAAHRRRGLGTAVILEALHRLRRMGASWRLSVATRSGRTRSTTR